MGKRLSMGSKTEEASAIDFIDEVNAKSLEEFVDQYMPERSQWQTWTHPATNTEYNLTLFAASALSASDFNACFELIKHTSSADYKKSDIGWKPSSKRKEMGLLDLKYLIVKSDEGKVMGFVSLMPTYEDDIPVVYCYEIHLVDELQGSGLGTVLMGYLDEIATRIDGVEKVMLTCFVRNEKGVGFYEKRGFGKDEFSPLPRVLRNGTRVEADYVILSKDVVR